MASCNDMKYFCLGKVLSICGKKIKKKSLQIDKKIIQAREPTNFGHKCMCTGQRSTRPGNQNILLGGQIIQFSSTNLKKKYNNHTGNYDNNNTDNDNLSIKIPKIAFLQARKTIQVNVLIK